MRRPVVIFFGLGAVKTFMQKLYGRFLTTISFFKNCALLQQFCNMSIKSFKGIIVQKNCEKPR